MRASALSPPLSPTNPGRFAGRIWNMRVLIVEDDIGIRRFLQKGLEEASFLVDVAVDGASGFEMARSRTYDIIVLDLMLPEKDGFSVLESLRNQKNDTPVICLTARDSTDDKIRGLDLGADDYLPKPFSFAELLARIRALLRRSRAVVKSPIKIAGLSVEIVSHTVERDGNRLALSAREYSLLECLALRAGEVHSRTMILERVWGMNRDPLTNVVEVHINRLRKKVDHGYDQRLIHTIRGVGYVLREEVD